MPSGIISVSVLLNDRVSTVGLSVVIGSQCIFRNSRNEGFYSASQAKLYQSSWGKTIFLSVQNCSSV